MIYAVGSINQSPDVQIVDDAGLGVTGLVAATFPATFFSVANAEAAEVAITLSDLPLITSPWSPGGIKERSGGYYRLDVPNAMFTAAGEIKVFAEANGKHLITSPFIVGALDSLATAVAGLTGAKISYVGPVAQNGQVTLIKGDDYRSADSRALTWVNVAGSWPNLTSATITLTIITVAGQLVMNTAGAVDVPSGANQQVHADLSSSQTQLTVTSPAAPAYLYAVTAVLNNGHNVTLQTGSLSVNEGAVA